MAHDDSTGAIVSFGDYCLDTRSLELRKGGMHVRLRHQPAQVLSLLVKRPNEVVTREELQQSLWGTDTFVDFERGLNNCIKQIRQALNDDPENPQYVETLPRVGYRFIASINPLPVVSPLPRPTLAGARQQPPSTSRGRPAILWKVVAGGAVLTAAAILFWPSFDKLRARVFVRSGSVEIHSLAVLPLRNLSRDPEQEYFSDGMTEALITDLAQIGPLKVISRTSTMRYKKTDKPLLEIARELNVDGIVEGSVQRVGSHVRITAQLVYGPADKHIWAESYERDLSDILALQDEVASKIAGEIGIELAGEASKRFEVPKRAFNPAAYEAYLKGSAYFNDNMNCTNFGGALVYFQKAIDQDPKFSPAYSSLAEDYFLLGDWRCWHSEPFDKAETLALKAMELDPGNARAHLVLAEVAFSRDWSWEGAGRQFTIAIDIGTQPTRTAFRCPWQNGVAERWVGSCRRDLLDHVIILNERHLKRLMSAYLLYYHEDRTHLGLAKDPPAGRPIETHSKVESKIRSLPRLGSLHYRYAVAA